MPTEASLFDRVDRVRERTSVKVNERIDQRRDQALARYQGADADAIRMRLEELDREWDIDRALMTFFSAAAMATLQAGLWHSRKWFALLGTQVFFIGVHAVAGWCPPLPVMRRLGLRTQKEIESEREALIAMMQKGTEAALQPPSSAMQ